MMAKRVLFLLIALVIVGTGIFVYVQQREPSSTEIVKAEHEVYTLLLEDQKNAYNDETNQLQIVEYTNSNEQAE